MCTLIHMIYMRFLIDWDDITEYNKNIGHWSRYYDRVDWVELRKFPPSGVAETIRRKK